VHKPPKNREGDHNHPGERGGSAIFSPQKAGSLLEGRIFSGPAWYTRNRWGKICRWQVLKGTYIFDKNLLVK